MKISAVVSAYNEEKRIAKCLKSLTFCDEIIVVDNESQDQTAQIAKEYGAKVYTQPNNTMLNINKNYGFEKASNTWILNLDADEEVSPELKSELVKLIQHPVFSAYKIPRKNIIFKKWIQHSLWWPDYQVRFFQKDKAKFSCNHVHEPLSVKGDIGVLNAPLIHQNYESISQFLYKMDKIYTESEVDNLIKSGKKVTWRDALWMPAGDFLKTFFLQEGYRDGVHGLVLSLLQSFYSLIVFAKYWERKNFEIEEPLDMRKSFSTEVMKVVHDLRHWIYQSEIKESKSNFKKFTLKIKRKVNL